LAPTYGAERTDPFGERAPVSARRTEDLSEIRKVVYIDAYVYSKIRRLTICLYILDPRESESGGMRRPGSLSIGGLQEGYSIGTEVAVSEPSDLVPQT